MTDLDLIVAIAEAVPEIGGDKHATDLIGALWERFPEAGGEDIVLGISTCQQRIATEAGVKIPRWRLRNPAEIVAAVLILPHLLLLGPSVNMPRTSAMIFASDQSEGICP